MAGALCGFTHPQLPPSREGSFLYRLVPYSRMGTRITKERSIPPVFLLPFCSGEVGRGSRRASKKRPRAPETLKLLPSTVIPAPAAIQNPRDKILFAVLDEKNSVPWVRCNTLRQAQGERYLYQTKRYLVKTNGILSKRAVSSQGERYLVRSNSIFSRRKVSSQDKRYLLRVNCIVSG
jgi:hypothetical protein